MRRVGSKTAVVLAASAVGLTLFGGAPAPSVDDIFAFVDHARPLRVPVVMVVFDELPLASLMTRSGHIDADHFPNFALLERETHWFRNTTTERGFSKEAIPGLLAGSYPEEQLYGYHVMPHNVFTLLGADYPIVTDEELPGLCPPDHCATRADVERPIPRLKAFGESDNGHKLSSFLHLLRETSQPRFHFLHLVFPHSPWIYLPSGRQYEEPGVSPGEVNPPGRGEAWTPDQWLVKQAYQRHLLQVQLADRVLGLVLRRLETTGMYDDSLVVVTADHGVAFVPAAPKRAITETTVGHVAPVPLFVKLPHQSDGHVSDVPARTIDVLPTIADALRLPMPWSDVDGRSLLEPASEDIERSAGDVVLDPGGSEKFQVVERKYAIFGRGPGGLDFYRLAPARSRHLIGVPVTAFEIARGARPSAVVPTLAAYKSVDRRDDYLPALRGTVPESSSPVRIAIAINGRIAAITQTYGPSNRAFLALVPSHFLRAGANDVRLYVLRSDLTLVRLRARAPEERLD